MNVKCSRARVPYLNKTKQQKRGQLLPVRLVIILLALEEMFSQKSLHTYQISFHVSRC